MNIVFLGTNGWYDTETGNTTCVLIETAHEYIIFDAGNGIYKADRFIKDDKPIYLFISHFHLDHIIGLHVLAKFNFKQGLDIYGQKGTRRVLKQIINKTFTAPFSRLSFKVRIHELSEGVHRIPFYLKTKFLLHPSKCLGYRIKLENKIITYCTDTGFCQNVIELAKDADLLITECAYKTGQGANNWSHLNPLSAAKIAKEAKARKLALMHFDAAQYKNFSDRESAEAMAKKLFKNTSAARDGLSISL